MFIQMLMYVCIRHHASKLLIRKKISTMPIRNLGPYPMRSYFNNYKSLSFSCSEPPARVVYRCDVTGSNGTLDCLQIRTNKKKSKKIQYPIRPHECIADTFL